MAYKYSISPRTSQNSNSNFTATHLFYFDSTDRFTSFSPTGSSQAKQKQKQTRKKELSLNEATGRRNGLTVARHTCIRTYDVATRNLALPLGEKEKAWRWGFRRRSSLSPCVHSLAQIDTITFKIPEHSSMAWVQGRYCVLEKQDGALARSLVIGLELGELNGAWWQMTMGRAHILTGTTEVLEGPSFWKGMRSCSEVRCDNCVCPRRCRVSTTFHVHLSTAKHFEKKTSTSTPTKLPSLNQSLRIRYHLLMHQPGRDAFSGPLPQHTHATSLTTEQGSWCVGAFHSSRHSMTVDPALHLDFRLLASC